MQENDKELPSITEQGKNLAKFTFEVVKNTVSLNGNPIVPNETYQERLSICQECEYYSKSKRCKKCGCFIESKARIAIAKCPLQKW